MERVTKELGTPMTVDEVIALEKQIEADGTPLLALMKEAGAALAEAAEQTTCENGSVLVFAGNGNNGGDGWVAVRLLAESAKDLQVTLIVAKTADELTAEPAKTAAAECMDAIEAGCPLQIVACPDAHQIEGLLASADTVIDAILGTGFSHEEVRAPFAHWIELINGAHSAGKIHVIAADCPSGLNTRTGQPTYTAIEADATVTMLAVKTGLLEESARPYTGEILLAPLL